MGRRIIKEGFCGTCLFVGDKLEKKALMIEIAIPSNSNIKKKEPERLKEYQGLKQAV